LSRKLTDKQQQFVLEYLKDLNATQAAIRAGYSEKTARSIAAENLSKPYIAEAIQEEMRKRSERVKITADDVLRDIVEIKDRCMRKEPVMEYDKETGEYYHNGEWQFDASNALKATQQLGKHLKLFTDVIEEKSEQDLNINFNIPRPKE
jgi:phage terminase small subunit